MSLEKHPQKILVTGSGGLVGSALVSRLEAEGHSVIRLVRNLDDADNTLVLWRPQQPDIDDLSRLEGLDAVVHLAGESIADGRWNPEKKMSIRNSRVQGTGFLARTLTKLKHKPKLFLCASAMGYYADHDEEWIDETGSIGTGFLAGVCRDWEAATQFAEGAGIRTVHMRISMVISQHGGALQKMLLPFRLGLGGSVGSGRQYWSWISHEDCVRAIQFLLSTDKKIQGPVNFAAPNPCTSRDFARCLGRVLHRPAVLPVPSFAARMALGEMADELLLKSFRLKPTVLEDAGFTFTHPTLVQALESELQSG